MATKKSKLKYVLILLLIVVIIGITFMYFSRKNGWQATNTAITGKAEAIGENGVYISEKYGFGLLFPEYWKGAVAQEKDGGMEFSLKDKNGKYIPIFLVRSFSDEEFAKLANQSGRDSQAPYFIAYKDGNDYAYFMRIGDDSRSDFGEPFSTENYKGFGYDVENNISTTFKFVDKGQGDGLKNDFKKSNEFRLMDVKEGSKVDGMTVKSIEPFDKNNADENSKNIYVNNVAIKFSGETSITGTYDYREANPAAQAGDLVCFYGLNEASRARIPSLLWSDQDARFCFSNQDAAKEAFGPVGSTGKATIVIDDYTINKLPANIVDVARLVRVEQK